MKVGKYCTEAASGARSPISAIIVVGRLGEDPAAWYCSLLKSAHTWPKPPLYEPHEKDCILVVMKPCFLDGEDKRINLLDAG